MRTFVFAKTRFEGLHCWSSILDNVEAQYLKNLHRHLFHIKVVINVFTALDREIEIIDLKHRIDLFLETVFPNKINGLPDMGTTSCELLCHILYDHFGAEKVVVSEDGENGAIVSRKCFK